MVVAIWSSTVATVAADAVHVVGTVIFTGRYFCRIVVVVYVCRSMLISG